MDEWEPSIDEPTHSEDRGWFGWVIGAIAVGAIAFAGWRYRDNLSGLFASAPPDAGVDAAIEAAPDAEAPPEKSLQEGDEVLRKVAGDAAKSPLVDRWLQNADVVQRLTAAARLIARGESPKPVLSFVEIQGDFDVVEQNTTKPRKPGKGKKKAVDYTERVFIAPESYRRYDGLVKLFSSMDVAYAGRSYRQMRPYFESAFAQVASPGERFDDVLRAAIKRLRSVHVPEAPIELVPKGAIYLYKDPKLEELSPAEKHVIRMGPKNAKLFQDTLRSFAAHAGVASE
jgi:DUF3014 family protein